MKILLQKDIESSLLPGSRAEVDAAGNGLMISCSLILIIALMAFIGGFQLREICLNKPC